MLTTLRIRNLALVGDLTLSLGPGYTAVTGETGAGKSVILGALNLVLGERADRGAIRAGTDQCSVEAVFEVKGLCAPLAEFLAENGLEPCEDGQLLLKRTFTASGSNRQFINGSPTTLATLERLGEWLVDLHGPHEHQSLLQPARQLNILDAFGGLEPRRAAFAEKVRERAGLEARKAELVVDERTYAQQLDLLRFQVREIEDARLQPEEEARLEAEHRRAANGARLLELAHGALAGLGEGDEAVLAQLGQVGRLLADLARLDPAAGQRAMDLHAQGVELLGEVQQELSRYVDTLDADPAALAVLEERLNLIQGLKRKYGNSVEDVLLFGKEARDRLESLEGRDEELARLKARIEAVDAELVRLGGELTAERRRLIPKLTRAVARELSVLGFAQSRLEVSLLPAPGKDGPATAGASGFDACEFLFAPNPGEPPRPLRAIASSGELARVMLALKTVLADQDAVPVLVFDEVDANVGGETAHAVGEKMRQIARRHQVLCITHLAPVAAHADQHLLVAKEVKAGRTESRIGPLDREGRIEELARMLGGGAAARRHAGELVGQPG